MKPSLLAVLIPCAVLAACNRAETPPATETAPAPATGAPAPASAQAALASASGSSVTGQLTFNAGTDGVTISGELSGLPPNTEHGFHLHAMGDCSAPDAASAGDHFNPDNKMHGGPTSTDKHLGDIPNIQADAGGKATVNAAIAGATLGDGGPHDLVGKAVIVHAMPDDYATQPSGNSGARIACGVIG